MCVEQARICKDVDMTYTMYYLPLGHYIKADMLYSMLSCKRGSENKNCAALEATVVWRTKLTL
jgi:hypothetical protein